MVFCIWFLCIDNFRLDDTRIRNGKNDQPNVGLAIPACCRNGVPEILKQWPASPWSGSALACASSPEICIHVYIVEVHLSELRILVYDI